MNCNVVSGCRKQGVYCGAPAGIAVPSSEGRRPGISPQTAIHSAGDHAHALAVNTDLTWMTIIEDLASVEMSLVGERKVRNGWTC